MDKYNWIKTETFCKWNDVALNDYDKEDIELAKSQIYEIVSIAYEDDSENIYDDTLILIENDYSMVECYAKELVSLTEIEKEIINNIINIRKYVDELHDNIRNIRFFVGINNINDKKTYYQEKEITSEMLNEWNKVVEDIKLFTHF